jgi:hypothetical protein
MLHDQLFSVIYREKISVFCYSKATVIYDYINYSISLRKAVFLYMTYNVSEEKGVSKSCPEGNVHLGDTTVYMERVEQASSRGIRINYQVLSFGADILLLGAREKGGCAPHIFPFLSYCNYCKHTF